MTRSHAAFRIETLYSFACERVRRCSQRDVWRKLQVESGDDTQERNFFRSAHIGDPR